MYMQIPVANRTVFQKDLQRTNCIHLNKIKNMKFANMSRLTTTPVDQSFNNVGGKKRPGFPEDMRERQIKKNNELIYRKIADIMHRQDVNNQSKKRSSILLHRSKTVADHQQIISENEKMYARILKQKPTVDTKKLEKDRMKMLHLLKRMGRYPYQMKNTAKNPNENEQIQQESVNQQSPNENAYKRKLIKSKSSMGYYNDNEEDYRNHSPPSNKKIVLWEDVAKVENNYFLLKIIRTPNNYQIVAEPFSYKSGQNAKASFTSYRSQSNDRSPSNQRNMPQIVKEQPKTKAKFHILVLTQAEGQQLLSFHNYNYKELCQLLRFYKGSLSLKNSFNTHKSNQYFYFDKYDFLGKQMKKKQNKTESIEHKMKYHRNNKERKTIFAMKNEIQEKEVYSKNKQMYSESKYDNYAKNMQTQQKKDIFKDVVVINKSNIKLGWMPKDNQQ